MSSYTAGFREIDVSDIQNQRTQETGFFDTYPLNNRATLTGYECISIFCAVIAISDSDRGLFLAQRTIK